MEKKLCPKKAGLISYDVLEKVPYWGIKPIPALAIRSTMLAKIEYHVINLEVSQEAQGFLIAHGIISARSPLDAIALFDDNLLESLVATGQAEEFNVSMRSLMVSPMPLGKFETSPDPC